MGDAADARRELAAARAAAKGKGGAAAAPPEKPKKEEKKASNRASRAEDALHEQKKKLQSMDLLHMGREELAADKDAAMDKLSQAKDKRLNRGAEPGQETAAQKAMDEDPGLFITFLRWVFAREKKPGMPWTISRREEIDTYLVSRSFGIYAFMAFVGGEGFWYNRIRRKKMEYVGERDPKTKHRERRGICWWPDPPQGGGESYHGMWRFDQPHLYGVFRWFDGDRYLGGWNDGELEGYGVYIYSGIGPHAHDRYEGAYHKGIRQGSGIYTYGNSQHGNQGGVYMGEWIQGKMHGKGFMLYPDGEHYIGDWKHDLKHGQGLYLWGPGSGDVSGDKYEGEFCDGNASGFGRTIFPDGGWHKGRYHKGKMHGWGIMRTGILCAKDEKESDTRSDGFEYTGSWKNDEMNGEFMTCFTFGMKEDKSVQVYRNGELVNTRQYDPGKDWAELEAPGHQSAFDADLAADEARKHVADVTEHAKRAKISQTMARTAADEAKYYCKAAMKCREFQIAWYGLKKYLFAED